MWKVIQHAFSDDFLSDEEIIMTGKKQPTIGTAAIRRKFQLAIQKNEHSHLFPKSFYFRVSTKPLASLSRTSVSNLLVNVPSEGNYILLRTLDLPVKSIQHSFHDSSVLVPVEDHHGQASICCVYGHVYFNLEKSVEIVVPVNTVFALKEPCLKYCSVGNFAVVVGSPSDFIKIDRSHALAKDVENLGWRSKITVEENLQSVSNLAFEWKVTGNEHFGKGKLEQAREAYLVALGFAKDLELELVLHLNLAAVYLSAGLYDLTNKHTKTVLEKEPNNEKALFRAGRAHYELRQYGNAKQYFESLLLVYPSNTKAASELDRCLARLVECSGNIDIYKLFKLNINNPLTPIDCGHYIGPIKRSFSTDYAHAVFAKEDLEPGSLILVEKSVDPTIISESYKEQEMWICLLNTIRAVVRNPKTFGRHILSLSNEITEFGYCDNENCLEPIIDVRHLIKILSESPFFTETENDYDAKEDMDIHNRRDALYSEMNNLISGNMVISVRKLLKIAKQVEETYKNRSILRVHLFRVYLPVARSFMKQGAEGWDKVFMACIERGLEAVGLSVELLLRTAEHEDSYLPRNALFWDDLFDYASLMVEKEFSCNRSEQVSRWVKVLMFLEHVFRGGNIKMLRDRFRGQESVNRILSKFANFEPSP